MSNSYQEVVKVEVSFQLTETFTSHFHPKANICVHACMCAWQCGANYHRISTNLYAVFIR